MKNSFKASGSTEGRLSEEEIRAFFNDADRQKQVYKEYHRDLALRNVYNSNLAPIEKEKLSHRIMNPYE